MVRGHQRGVADGLTVDVCGVVVDGLGVGVVVQRVDESGLDAVPGRRMAVVCVGTPVERGGGDDVVAHVRQQEGREVQRGHPRRGGDGTHPAFECGQPFLELPDGGVHQPGVDMARFLQGELGGGVLGVLEDVGGRLVDRWGPRSGFAVRLFLPDVQGVCLESAVVVAHTGGTGRGHP